MGLLTKALIIVMVINMFFIIGQMSSQAINEEVNSTYFYDCSNDFLSRYDQNSCVGGNYTLVKYNESALPSGQTNVGFVEGVTNFFTDIFQSVKNWVLSAVGLPPDLFDGPYRFLQSLNLPDGLAWVFGAFWYGLTIFLVVNWLKGGDA